MGPKTHQLVAVLDQLIELLESEGERHWSCWIRRSRERILACDYSGIELLLRAYGGMGSFNDFSLRAGADTRESKVRQTARAIDRRLDELRTTAWDLAEAVRRDRSCG